MKLKPTLGAAAFAAFAFATPRVHATNTTTAPPEDLMLCFESSGGTGSGTDLEVDLGNYKTLSNMPGLSINLSSELNGLYGTSWSTDGDVSWAIVAENSTLGGATSDGLPGKTDWITAPYGGIGQDPISTGQQGEVATDISEIYSGFNGLQDDMVTNAATISGGMSTSFTYNNTGNGTNGVNIQDQVNQDEVTINGVTQQDLWQLEIASSGNTATDINTFTLGTNGVLTAAVPEPSVWASLVLGAMALLGFRRRRA